ncbi:MAG: proline--tRNA ligase [Elusimicrobiota bacterium]
MKKSRKFSQYFVPTLKEDPQEAEIPSHKLMVRAGMIRKLASGVYEFLPLGWKVVKKVEQIVREEMDNIGGQELIMSAMQPKSLWEKSKRWDLYGDELIRFEDRKEREFCLGPTHEEVITHIIKKNVDSYKKLPLLLYQFQMKFRDEIRPRFGIMRAREFYMKDAYSFDTTKEGCQKSYRDNYEAYSKIFKRCGLDFKIVEAETGNIGGESSHEFMVLADTGEEIVTFCDCGYGANRELAGYEREEIPQKEGEPEELEQVHTPDVRTVEEVAGFMDKNQRDFIKTLIYNSDNGPVVCLVRGDHEINENTVGEQNPGLEMGTQKLIDEVTGGPLGFSGPVGLKKDKIHKIYADRAVLKIKNAVSGANKKDYHLKNINYGRDYKVDEVGDFRKVIEGDKCPKCGSGLKFKRGIEVGHTFLLGTKYSESMDAKFTDSDGKQKDIIMGCYGIGVTRVVAAAIEQSHDEDGIIWPKPLAPFDITILQIGSKTDKICKDLYNRLSKKYEILWDDRPENPGVKFKDAELIGIPVQIIAGKSFLNKGKLEVQLRKEKKKTFVELENLDKFLSNYFEKK